MQLAYTLRRVMPNNAPALPGASPVVVSLDKTLTQNVLGATSPHRFSSWLRCPFGAVRLNCDRSRGRETSRACRDLPSDIRELDFASRVRRRSLRIQGRAEAATDRLCAETARRIRRLAREGNRIFRSTGFKTIVGNFIIVARSPVTGRWPRAPHPDSGQQSSGPTPAGVAEIICERSRGA